MFDENEIDSLVREIADLQADLALAASKRQRKGSCGANSKGGGGFQPGNRCAAKGAASGQSSDSSSALSSVEFDAWFGDSKVVDPTGAPMVVHHGTHHEFDTFSNPDGNQHNLFGPGFYFAESKDFAGGYAFGGPKEYTATGSAKEVRQLAGELKNRFKEIRRDADPMQTELLNMDISRARWIQWFGAGDEDLSFLHTFADTHGIAQDVITERSTGSVMDTYLSIQKPFDADVDTLLMDMGGGLEPVKYSDARYTVPGSIIQDALIAEGYDGITGMEMGDGTENSRVWVAFYPEQIKSTANEGGFDPASQSIYKSKRKHLPGMHDQADHGLRFGSQGDVVDLEASLGIDRSEMPQIPASHQEEFEDWLDAKGIAISDEMVSAVDLIPTQKHVSRSRIEHVKEGIRNKEPKLIDKEQYVSQEGYILDGHHRWAAMAEMGIEIPIRRIDLPIGELMVMASDFNAEHDIVPRGVESQTKHLGPGPHPNGSPQSIHGMAGKRGRAKRMKVIERPSSHYKPHNTKGTDTNERFIVSEGETTRYTPERAELHEAIYAEMMSEGRIKDRTFTILGGGAASGKSTLIKNDYVDIDHSIIINADDIKEKLPEYREMLETNDPQAAAFAHEESSGITKEAMKRAAKSGYDYVLDGTGNSEIGTLRRKTEVAKRNGYTIAAEYVTVDTALAEARNLARAQKTGRMVPPAALRHAHEQVSKVLPLAISEGLFDTAKLWDTNDSTMEVDRTELVMEYKDGKMNILNDTKWQMFLAKAEGN